MHLGYGGEHGVFTFGFVLARARFRLQLLGAGLHRGPFLGGKAGGGGFPGNIFFLTHVCILQPVVKSVYLDHPVKNRGDIQ